MFSKTGIPLFEEMTWREVADALKQTDICILPVGAIEQHGYHLPLGTDTYIAQEIACRACAILRKRGGMAVVGPSIPYGVHPEAMHYPGSLQLKPTTLIQILKELCVGLKQMGFRHIVLLMGHDGNIPAMQVAVQELEIEEALDVMCVNWLLPHLGDQKRIVPLDFADGHGGARETSRALYAFPDLVKMELAEPYIPTFPQKSVPCSAEPVLGGAVYRPIKISSMEYYPENCPGQDGDASFATAEAGDALYDALGTWLADLMVQEYELDVKGEG